MGKYMALPDKFQLKYLRGICFGSYELNKKVSL